MNVQHKKVEEFDILVPWGHIAVKTWGNKDDIHTLMIHGTGDNAGTFDNLIPLLSNSFYYICIDLPSHGKSSHFPPHTPIHTDNFILALKFTAEYFKKDKYVFIGHSLGSQIGGLFAQLYPHYIEKFISLDAIPVYFPVKASEYIDTIRKLMDQNIYILEKLGNGKAPSYIYEEILEKFRKTRYRGEILTREAAIPLLNRSLKPTGNGKYILTTDQRIKALMDPLNDSQYKIQIFKNNPITCPMCFIFTKANSYHLKIAYDFIKTLQTFKNVTILYVDGKHDIHNNKPELVAVHINKFLSLQKSKM